MKILTKIIKKPAIWLLIFSTVFWSTGFPYMVDGPNIAKAAHGEGNAFLRVNGFAGDGKVNAGSYYDFEIELEIGATGMEVATSMIEVVIPTGFTAPQVSNSDAPGYVMVDTYASTTLNATTNGQTIAIDIASGSPLVSGDKVIINYGYTQQGVYPDAAALIPNEIGATRYFMIRTKDTAAASLATLSNGYPHVNIVSPIVISEIQTNGNNIQTNEFVELYNTSSSTVDIRNWVLTWGTATSTGSIAWEFVASTSASSTIPAYGYYLFNAFGYNPLNASGTPVTADTYIASTSSFDGNFSNHGYVAINNASGTIIDLVGYGSLSDESLAEGGDSAPAVSSVSIERKAYGDSTATDMAPGGIDWEFGNGYDSDNNGLDFVWQASSSPQNTSSPPEAPDYGVGGDVGIWHMPINRAPDNSPLTLVARMGDPSTEMEALGAELKYMEGDGSPGNNTYDQYSTAVGSYHGNGYFLFTIPQTTITNSTSTGLYYYLKAVGNADTVFMSASPIADQTDDEVQVAMNPFIVSVEDPVGWTTHDISGTVYVDGTSSSVPDALIFLKGTGYVATSTAGGNIALNNVRDDSYNLVVSKEGFYEEWRNLNLFGSDITNHDIYLSQGSGGGAIGESDKPYVKWHNPYDGDKGVPAGDSNYMIFIGFSEEIDSTTFSTTTVLLTTDGSTPVPGYIVDYNPIRTAEMPSVTNDPYLGVIYPPSGGLATGTTYYLVLSDNIRDMAGNSIEGNNSNGEFEISFSTVNDYSTFDYGSGAYQPPYVSDIKPYPGAQAVPPNTKINITFSQTMDEQSVETSGNIYLQTVDYISGAESTSTVVTTNTLDSSGKVATIDPGALTADQKYRVIVTGAVRSDAGIWMGDPLYGENTPSFDVYRSSFRVSATDDISPPYVLGKYPEDGDTDIPVNLGNIQIQFSENLDPATVNVNTVTLKRGTSLINTEIKYDAMAQSVYISPKVVLATEADYTVTLTGSSTGITDMTGNALASDYTFTFTTDASYDSSDPELMYANGDEYGVAITFSEPVRSAKITDTMNYPYSVLNKDNFILKWGAPATVDTAGTEINLSSSQIYYDSYSNTVFIDNLGLATSSIGMAYYVDLSTSSITDLAGNFVASSSYNTFQFPISSSTDTGGDLGPSSDGTYDAGDMGIMKAGAWPMNSMAGQRTVYFVDVPTSKAIPAGGKIVITFPSGFGIYGAEQDPYSPINDDINESNDGTVTFSTDPETTGGADDDGVEVSTANRTVTVTTSGSSTQEYDYLHFDLAGIVNPTIPRDYETSGYSLDIKTLDDNGVMLENIETMPVFISPGGQNDLTVTLNGITSGDNGDVYVFLDSPMTGPMDKRINFQDDTSSSTIFENLPDGDYYIYTEPTVTLNNGSPVDYEGVPSPEPIYLTSSTTKTIAMTRVTALNRAAITVNINGSFNNEDLDVWAGGPTSYRVKTLTGVNGNTQTTLYLPDGSWNVGVEPAMPMTSMYEPVPMPDWRPPVPVEVRVENNGANVYEYNGTTSDSIIDLDVSVADKQIIGYVTDGSGNAIADADIWAYQPMGSGMGSYSKTDTNGKFTLKIADTGNYKVGTFKPGLPYIPERGIVLKTNTLAPDSNTTADVYLDNGSLITDANRLAFKLKKGDYTISGKVTDGTNAVAYAPVWADEIDGYGHADTMTDASGNYILYVNSGTWRINSYIPEYGDADPEIVVINDADETINLAPDLDTTYVSIRGTVSDGSPLSYLPIRAVQYTATGIYTGREYTSNTDSIGNYAISVPSNNYYRVDIWTPEYGEVGLDVNGVPNNPANLQVFGIDTSGNDITINTAALNTIGVIYNNGTTSQEGFLNIDQVEFTGGAAYPTGMHKSLKVTDLSTSTTVELPDGDYFFFLDVIGLGHYTPTSTSIDATKTAVEISSDKTVEFTLPDNDTETVTISGTVTDGSDPLADAWVWIGNPENGYHSGEQTASDGTYSLSIPLNTGYKMGADKPGHIPTEPTDVDATTSLTQNFTISSSSISISGITYDDTNTDNNYDSGEEVANGFVRAETVQCSYDDVTGCRKSYAPVDGDGYYQINVVDGDWVVYANADGYEESTYYDTGNSTTTVTVSGSSLANIDVKLTLDSNWENRSKKMPITPSSGGSMDDTATSGTGIKLTIPPNALGNSSESGNINANRTSAVARTNSSAPVGNSGVNVTASDNSGQNITNLNDYIDMEIVLYKADIDAAIASGTVTYGELRNTKNGYWDSTVNDWVNLATTRIAYYKNNIADTEWIQYKNSATTTSAFEAFINELAAGDISPADYMLMFKSKTNHLTVYAVIMPYIATPAQAGGGGEPEEPDNPNPPSSGGGGGTPSCREVIYEDWGNCLNGWQYRNVLETTPTYCRLTNDQESARTQVCSTTEDTLTEATGTEDEYFEETDVEITQTDPGELYYTEADMIMRAEVDEILPALGIAERNHVGEQLSRGTLSEKLKINLNLLEPRHQYALTNFITYGSPNTAKLGWGERAGVMNSFMSAFGKIPETVTDWQDVVKIANGRWPSQRSEEAETKALEFFRIIYLRDPNRENPKDDAAVTVIAYGLRPAGRNMDSEAAAIRIFSNIFKYAPASATDWDIVRAIAYSGATR